MKLTAIRGGQTMKLRPIQSSMLSDAGYDEKKHELGVIFKTGGLYIYENVPRSIYTRLMEVHSVGDSVGAYMHKYVIDKYPHRRMSQVGGTTPAAATTPKGRSGHNSARKTTSIGQVSKGKVLQFRQKRDAVQNRER
jgi:biotin carboxylase